MKERNVDLINLTKIDLIKGRSNVDLNQFSKLLTLLKYIGEANKDSIIQIY